MLAIWFTFGPDGPCLIESVGAFRLAAGRVAKVAVIDDAANPLSAECLRTVKPDFRQRTAFPRGGNLRGWPCVLGMLDTMASVCRAANEPGCLKVDSDTVVFGLDWLDRQAPLCGFMSGRNAYAVGMCYWMTLETIDRVRMSFESRWLQPGWRAPEDQTITGEALRHHGRDCVLHTWDTKLAGGWQYDRVDESRFDPCQVITFGNRRLISGCSCRHEARTLAAVEMARYRKRRLVDSAPQA